MLLMYSHFLPSGSLGASTELNLLHNRQIEHMTVTKVMSFHAVKDFLEQPRFALRLACIVVFRLRDFDCKLFRIFAPLPVLNGRGRAALSSHMRRHVFISRRDEFITRSW